MQIIYSNFLVVCLSIPGVQPSILPWSLPHLLVELLCNALGPQEVELLALGRAVDVSHLYQHLHNPHPLLLTLPVDGTVALDVLQESCDSHMTKTAFTVSSVYAYIVRACHASVCVCACM